jgi:hypothetical protein
MPKKYLLSVIISIITILILPVTILPISADNSAETNASTRYVAVTGVDAGSSCTDPTAPCRNIQYAINQSASGDTIKVAAGTYTYAAASDICPTDQSKSVVCTYQKALTLLGGYTTSNWAAAYPTLNRTVIDGQDIYRGVRHYSYSSTSHLLDMEGFTIRNGRSTGTSTLDAMGGGLIALRASLILRDMLFENNQAIGFPTASGAGGKADGAAIRIQSEDALGSTALLQRVVVQNNQSYGGYGPARGGEAFGALFIYNAAVTIEDSIFTNNLARAGDAPTGNGVYAPPGRPLRADALGGAIVVMNASLTMARTYVTGNEIQGGDANSVGFGGGAYGGGIFVEGVDIHDGHGLYISSITMTDCYVAENQGTSGSAGTGGRTAGGGFDAVDSQVTIERTQFINNSILGGNKTGTGISGNGAGGGLFIWAQSGGIPSAILKNVVIADNYANHGNGTTESWNGGGGGLFIWGIDAEIRHATFARNHLGTDMTNGEAIYLDASLVHDANVFLYDSIISDHNLGNASASLGNVNAETTLNLSRGIFAENGSNSFSGGGNIVGTYTSVSSAGYISSGSPKDNYHLRYDSPAKNAATLSTMTEDFESQSRPYGASRDYGADEYYPFAIFAGVGDGILQVDWAKDVAYLAGGVDYYTLTLGCSGGEPADQVACGGTVTVGEGTHFTLTGLSNGFIYTLTVQAYDSADDKIAESYQASAKPSGILVFLPLLLR